MHAFLYLNNSQKGKPKNCPVLTVAPDTPGYAKYQAMVDAICKPKCLSNTYNACKNHDAVTAGIVGNVCMCYCPD